MEQGSKVRIDVLDILGKPVSNLLDDYQAQGLHEINWTSDNNLEKGVYFIRLQKDQRTYFQKVIKVN